jgi:hypothetical protein
VSVKRGLCFKSVQCTEEWVVLGGASGQGFCSRLTQEAKKRGHQITHIIHIIYPLFEPHLFMHVPFFPYWSCACAVGHTIRNKRAILDTCTAPCHPAPCRPAARSLVKPPQASRSPEAGGDSSPRSLSPSRFCLLKSLNVSDGLSSCGSE